VIYIIKTAKTPVGCYLCW